MTDDAKSDEATRSQISGWRMRAEEARKAGNDMANPEARDTLEKMAETYDRLADTAQARLDLAVRGTVLAWKPRRPR